jgi:DNA-binding transcriptional regulator YiaG
MVRKEGKKIASSVGKDLESLSKSINRRISKLETRIARLEKKKKRGPGRPRKAVQGKKSQITPQQIKALRKKLKINQAGLAKLIGVSMPAVSSWEQGRAKPRQKAVEVIKTVKKMKAGEARDRLGSVQKRKKRVREKRAVPVKKSVKMPVVKKK